MPRRLSQPEFIALMAVTFSVVAFSIDSMLAALPLIAQDLTPDAPNHAQMVLSAFVLGLGLGIFFCGPLSDSLGRRPVMLWGFALYAGAAAVAAMAPTLEIMLAARLVQGLGAAAPRIVGLAMIRDLYEGRGMARITSFVMMVFLLIPAVAPLMGAGIAHLAGWRGIFWAFVLFALVVSLWLGLRQGETLPVENKRDLSWRALVDGTREVLNNRRVMITTAAISFGFGQLFASIQSIQPIYDESFGRAASFPLFFAIMALLSSGGTILNAALVMRMGMRRLISMAFLALLIATPPVLGFFAIVGIGHPLAFPVFFAWTVLVFLSNGLTFGNLNALALQPLGHMAGLGASVVGAISTVASVLIALPIGLMFNGTPLPLMVGVILCSTVALWLTRQTIET